MIGPPRGTTEAPPNVEHDEPGGRPTARRGEQRGEVGRRDQWAREPEGRRGHRPILPAPLGGTAHIAPIPWSATKGPVVNELIDTTEMYLRTIYELEEEGVVPLRARIAERLGQSGPTVSQTVARMERDGLVVVGGDRHLELTGVGRGRAVAVMRKHRLAERLLVDVIGLEWEHVHAEACRWEHVMSEAVERKLVALLDNPTVSPYGNPIPGLDELERTVGGPDVVEGEAAVITAPATFEVGLQRLDELARRGGGHVEVRRIAEHVQVDADLMVELKSAGVVPGQDVEVGSISRFGEAVPVSAHDSTPTTVVPHLAHAVLVRAR
jgi:DtxR family Mn-dependent transcriptional regulator